MVVDVNVGAEHLLGTQKRRQILLHSNNCTTDAGCLEGRREPEPAHHLLASHGVHRRAVRTFCPHLTQRPSLPEGRKGL